MRKATSAKSNTRASPRASPKRRAKRESHVIGNRPLAGKATKPSFFPECPHELILQGLDQVRHHRALAGLDESLDWHARDEFDVTEPGDFIFRHGDAGGVIVLAGALICRGISGNAGNGATDFRGCPQI